jgi:hypothetical protein
MGMGEVLIRQSLLRVGPVHLQLDMGTEASGNARQWWIGASTTVTRQGMDGNRRHTSCGPAKRGPLIFSLQAPIRSMQ